MPSPSELARQEYDRAAPTPDGDLGAKLTGDVMVSAGMVADHLRPLVLSASGPVLVERGWLTSAYEHMERLAELDGEVTLRQQEHGKAYTHGRG